MPFARLARFAPARIAEAAPPSPLGAVTGAVALALRRRGRRRQEAYLQGAFESAKATTPSAFAPSSWAFPEAPPGRKRSASLLVRRPPVQNQKLNVNLKIRI